MKMNFEICAGETPGSPDGDYGTKWCGREDARVLRGGLSACADLRSGSAGWRTLRVGAVWNNNERDGARRGNAQRDSAVVDAKR